MAFLSSRIGALGLMTGTAQTIAVGVSLRSVSYRYPTGDVALEGITAEFLPGRRTVLLGPNGAGKTTLLLLLAGQRFPFEGEVRLGDDVLTPEAAERWEARIGLLYQDPEDDMLFPTAPPAAPAGEAEEPSVSFSRRLLRRLSLHRIAEREPHRLSYGEKRRAAVAEALSGSPELLLLDEPTAALDPISRHEIVEVLQELPHTMVIATHDVELAAELADRILLLNRTVVADGTARDVLLDREALARCQLEPPTTARSWTTPEEAAAGPRPLSIEEARARLARLRTRAGEKA